MSQTLCFIILGNINILKNALLKGMPAQTILNKKRDKPQTHHSTCQITAILLSSVLREASVTQDLTSD